MMGPSIKDLGEVVNANDSLYQVVMGLKRLPFDLDPTLETNPELRDILVNRVDTVSDRALNGEQPDARLDFHRTLRELLKLRTVKHTNRHELSYHLNALTTRMTKSWLEQQMQSIELGDVPRFSAAAFQTWFTNTINSHPASDHPLYRYLEEQAGIQEFKYFVAQERTVDADFADFIALTQIGAGFGPKLQMAHNYWEEMGSGDLNRAHAQMFNQVLSALDIVNEDESDLSWASLACGNLYFILSLHRCYYYMRVGCLAATEDAVFRKEAPPADIWSKAWESGSGPPSRSRTKQTPPSGPTG